MGLADDLRFMITSTAGLTGQPTAVTLASGAVVQASASVASTDDALGGEGVIEGQTRALTFTTEDVPGLAARATLTWNGKSWLVLKTTLRAQGALTRAFLGAAS